MTASPSIIGNHLGLDMRVNFLIQVLFVLVVFLGSLSLSFIWGWILQNRMSKYGVSPELLDEAKRIGNTNWRTLALILLLCICSGSLQAIIVENNPWVYNSLSAAGNLSLVLHAASITWYLDHDGAVFRWAKKKNYDSSRLTTWAMQQRDTRGEPPGHRQINS